jgi:tRNA-2-methylthio-N6-dimethylallyladenosine synthase
LTLADSLVFLFFSLSILGVAQQEGKNLIVKYPEIDAVIGPQYVNRFGEFIPLILDGYRLVMTDPSYQNEDSTLPIRKSGLSAFVNVIYGCNERCTYCVVPNTRGVEQSRTIEAIVNEIEGLIDLGYKEVTLLGQNIDSWGR